LLWASGLWLPCFKAASLGGFLVILNQRTTLQSAHRFSDPIDATIAVN
jgi:hypothetical protein